MPKNTNIAQHEYHDYANVIEQDLEEMTKQSFCTDSNSKKVRRGPRGGVATPFPVKLHQLLEEDKYPEIISWQPHGRCFILRKPQEFLLTVMTKYFKQTKLTSFQRQLNLYAFRRISSGPDKGAYYHELFLRGKSALCHHIYRLRVKGTKIKSASCPENEPNFYQLPPMESSTSLENKYVSEDDTEFSIANGPKNKDRTISFDDLTPDIASSNPCDDSVTETYESDSIQIDLLPTMYPIQYQEATSQNQLEPPKTFIYSQGQRTNSSMAVEFAGKEFFYLDHMDHWDACTLPLEKSPVDRNLMGLSVIDGEICGFETV